MITRPMLAGRCSDINKLKYPVLATPKLDGIRCLVLRLDGRIQAVSRNFKPIPNDHVRNWLEANCPLGFDGELIMPGGTFQDTSSAIMSHSGQPKFEYQVFDWTLDPRDTYENRVLKMEVEALASFPPNNPNTPIQLILPKLIRGPSELEEFEQVCLTLGYEGVMVRTPNSPYKCGRSTEKEGWLLKIKRFYDAEAVIIGFEEKMHNSNEATLDELGRTKRSSHKANLEPMDTLGALIVRDIKTGVTFNIGTGFSDDTRTLIWSIRNKGLIGKVVKYKSQPTGVLDKPRFPVFLGFRSTIEG